MQCFVTAKATPNSIQTAKAAPNSRMRLAGGLAGGRVACANDAGGALIMHMFRRQLVVSLLCCPDAASAVCVCADVNLWEEQVPDDTLVVLSGRDALMAAPQVGTRHPLFQLVFILQPCNFSNHLKPGS
jgi:hypothetical protein